MNRIKHTIGYADFSWNPVVGCLKGCFYCYARRLSQTEPLRQLYLANENVAPKCDLTNPFSPRFFPERLREPSRLRQPARILTVDMGDLFGPWVPMVWVRETLKVAQQCYWHTFLFLTKFPFYASKFDFPPNAWVGTTVEKDFFSFRITGLYRVKSRVRFISAEPLLGRISKLPNWLDWLIIGAMTGPEAIRPEMEWVEELIQIAKGLGIPIFLKRNLKSEEPRQEWPKVKQDFQLPEMQAIFAHVGRMEPILVKTKLNIGFKLHGFLNGWFNWPFLFDPVWLEFCDGFEKKKEKENEQNKDQKLGN